MLGYIIGRLIQGAEEFPLNFGFLGRGCGDPGAVEESVAGGALGVKIHEDYGASPAVLDGSLIAADRNDFSVHINTDTINEFGFCEDTLATIGKRTVQSLEHDDSAAVAKHGAARRGIHRPAVAVGRHY